MSNVYQYALLAEDPTTKSWVCWVDDTGNGGDEQSVSLNDNQYADSGEQIPESDAYIYNVQIDELIPDTTYDVEIDSTETVETELKTLPEERPDSLDIGMISDTHHNREAGMIDVAGGPDPMRKMAEKDHDLLLLIGDISFRGWDIDEDNSEEWLEWWSDYWSPLVEDQLVPVFAVPGNHELGNSEGVAPGVNDPNNSDRAYWQIFFPSNRDLGPTEENYHSITVGDYLQLIGLDTHTAWPEDQADWMKEITDESIDLCIPIHHVSMLPGISRPSSDEDVQRHLHNEWSPVFAETDNIHFTACGNEHSRKLTKRMGVVDSEPAGEYFELNDGRYLTNVNNSKNGFREAGDGWMNDNRGVPDLGDWYLDRIDDTVYNGEQYYYICIEQDRIRLDEYNLNGRLMTRTRINDESLVVLNSATVRSATF